MEMDAAAADPANAWALDTAALALLIAWVLILGQYFF